MNDEETRSSRTEFIAAGLAVLVLLVCLIVSVVWNVRAGDVLDSLRVSLSATTASLARAEMLANQYKQDNGYLETEYLRVNAELEALKALPTKVVYRCAEKRPVPVFEPEWHLGAFACHAEDVAGFAKPVTVCQ